MEKYKMEMLTEASFPTGINRQDWLKYLEIELAAVELELLTAKGKRKRHLKKWKTRLQGDIKKETLILKLK